MPNSSRSLVFLLIYDRIETREGEVCELNLLFVIDDAYVEQYKVVLFSIAQQMPHQDFQVFIMQKVLLEKDAEIGHFVDCVINDKIPLIDGVDGAKTIETCWAVINSIATGKPQKVLNEF